MGRVAGIASKAASKGKTFLVPLTELYVEDGHNIREVDDEHVAQFKESYLAGNYVPPLLVRNTEDGLRIVFGHHRYYGFEAACAEGCTAVGIECTEYKGSVDDEVALMVRENDGKPLTGMERAGAYYRLQQQGWDINRIAAEVSRSRSDVEKHLILDEATDDVKALIIDGTIPVSTAIEFVRKHGVDAMAEITKQLAKQAGVSANRRAGASKVQNKPKFSAQKALRVLELLGPELVFELVKKGDPDFVVSASLPAAVSVEFNDLIEDYLEWKDNYEAI